MLPEAQKPTSFLIVVLNPNNVLLLITISIRITYTAATSIDHVMTNNGRIRLGNFREYFLVTLGACVTKTSELPVEWNRTKANRKMFARWQMKYKIDEE